MGAAEPYEFDDTLERIDVEAVWQFLSTEAYWARWRPRDIFEAQLRSAWRVVGAYEVSSGRQVGFARAFSDGYALAYLADVFVVPEHRGRGVSVGLLRKMIDEGPGARFQWMLHTRDAHGLYEKFGFGPRTDGRYMERPSQLA